MPKCLHSDTTQCVCFFAPPCGFDRAEGKVFRAGTTQEKNLGGVFKKAQRTHTAGWLNWRVRWMRMYRPGKADSTGKWCIDELITSTKWAAEKLGLIFTAECVAQVGPERTAAVSISVFVIGGGSVREGLMIIMMMLTFSMPPPRIQQAPRVKLECSRYKVGLGWEDSEQSFFINSVMLLSC